MKYNVKTDLHTHTLMSGHAYSTLEENIRYAASIGFEAIAMTNHGPYAKDFSHEWHFCNLNHIPRNVNGLMVFTGVECSFVDTDGTLAMDETCLNLWIL